MTPRELEERAKQFGIRCLRLAEVVSGAVVHQPIARQLLRSGTSVGANYRAANRARSRDEFIAKLGTVVEEADETLHWLELIRETRRIPAARLDPLILEASELLAIFSSSRKTAKSNREGPAGPKPARSPARSANNQITRSPNRQMRVGLGYDIHRLVAGRPLILGGVRIPHAMGLDGHSDADVLCHAIADALLGAAGQRDIGHHFPNTDESIRGISSIEILRRVRTILKAAGFEPVNVDATLVAEAPKIGPHIDRMQARIARAIRLKPGCVGIKATTNEMLGALGRREGMAALAVASVRSID